MAVFYYDISAGELNEAQLTLYGKRRCVLILTVTSLMSWIES